MTDFPIPFHIPQLVRSLPFHIPEVYKRYSFRMKPLRRGSILASNSLLTRTEKKIRRARNDRGKTGEPVDFIFDVTIRPWWPACNKSVNAVIRPVKKLHFLYLQLNSCNRPYQTAKPGVIIRV